MKKYIISIILSGMFLNAISQNLDYASQLYNKGCEYYLKNDYSSAFQYIKQSANYGYTPAIADLGRCYYYGLGTARNYYEAFRLYQIAANNGDAGAQFRLANMYFDGEGTSQNDRQGIYWLKKSVEQGYAPAQGDLAMSYFSGNRGVPVNYVEAARLFRKAAEQGDIHSQFYIGQCYQYGYGVPKDSNSAAYWYKKMLNNPDIKYLTEYKINTARNFLRSF